MQLFVQSLLLRLGRRDPEVGNGGISEEVKTKTAHICASPKNLCEAIGLGWGHGMGWDFGDEIMACLHVRVIVQESFISSGTLNLFAREYHQAGKAN